MTALLLNFGILLFSIICHEIAHGWAAYKLGDPTAKNAGRLTFNPIPHVDILGSILLPAFLILSHAPIFIGWAKPVPVDSRHFKSPLSDMMLVAAAGPLSNAFLVFLAWGVYQAHPTGSLAYAALVTISINLILGLFNLFPIPPLDGSRIILPFLPDSLKTLMLKMEPYGLLIVFVLAYFNVFSIALGKVIPPILSLLLGPA